MTDFQLAGRMVQGIRRPSRRFAEGRVCVHDGCGTMLSIYNPTRFCSQHETTRLNRTFGRQPCAPPDASGRLAGAVSGHNLSGVPIRDLPDARERLGELSGRVPAVFLDYDGTLTPIVPDPDRALLPEPTRDALLRVRDRWPIAVVSGRDLADVRGKVGIEGIAYAGSHGFEIVTPDGRHELRGADHLPDLDAAEAELRGALPSGARLDRKRVAIAVHVRGMDPDRVPEVAGVVEEVGVRHHRLRLSGGKAIFELRPDLDWDKGRALRWFLEVLGLTGDEVVPVYVGDDVTDEDAFREVRDSGLAVVVRGEDDARPTLAHAALDGPDEVRGFLEAVANLR